MTLTKRKEIYKYVGRRNLEFLVVA